GFNCTTTEKSFTLTPPEIAGTIMHLFRGQIGRFPAQIDAKRDWAGHQQPPVGVKDSHNLGEYPDEEEKGFAVIASWEGCFCAGRLPDRGPVYGPRPRAMYVSDPYGTLRDDDSRPGSERAGGYAFRDHQRRQGESLRNGHRESEWEDFFQCHGDRNLYRRS